MLATEKKFLGRVWGVEGPSGLAEVGKETNCGKQGGSVVGQEVGKGLQEGNPRKGKPSPAQPGRRRQRQHGPVAGEVRWSFDFQSTYIHSRTHVKWRALVLAPISP